MWTNQGTVHGNLQKKKYCTWDYVTTKERAHAFMMRVTDSTTFSSLFFFFLFGSWALLLWLRKLLSVYIRLSFEEWLYQNSCGYATLFMCIDWYDAFICASAVIILDWVLNWGHSLLVLWYPPQILLIILWSRCYSAFWKPAVFLSFIPLY